MSDHIYKIYIHGWFQGFKEKNEALHLGYFEKNKATKLCYLQQL